ncbi:predicted protein [Arabidopsis lyrata subsp. lyrata]|uniref:Predicted protein n=1 Tax=Arabidopsis lyrata subsp. lyrata TaxID=81972 RepID=D7MKD5_ARALL|nr:predicted protein [Arabidopsis lyrata subsp. lyrata]
MPRLYARGDSLGNSRTALGEVSGFGVEKNDEVRGVFIVWVGRWDKHEVDGWA